MLWEGGNGDGVAQPSKPPEASEISGHAETSPYLFSPPLPLRCDQVKNGLSSVCSPNPQVGTSFQPYPDLLAPQLLLTHTPGTYQALP